MKFEKIKWIPIPITNVEDELTWKVTSHDDLYVKKQPGWITIQFAHILKQNY